MNFLPPGASRLLPLLAVAALSFLAAHFTKEAPAGPASAASPLWAERVPSPVVAGAAPSPSAERRAHLLAGALRTRAVGAARTGALVRGARVSLPLFDGSVSNGVVRLARPRADGGTLVGGELDDGGGFTLAFEAGAGGATEGLILPAGDGPAYRLIQADDGGALLAELPRGSVLCATLPRPPRAGRSTTIPRASRTGRSSTITQAGAAGAVQSAATTPLHESRPEAEPVLYLDFDGETVNDPVWNRGQTITAAPSGLTAAEITRVWRMVAEDYRPFRVNVTTDPARYAAARPMQRMRCIITPTRAWYGDVGGVALIFSWRDAGAGAFAEDVPCWVFTEPGVMLPDDVALAVSHEAGHTFGLYHDGLRGEDGTTPPEGDYYAGHGAGAASWGPIMGAPYGKAVIQWSRGDYAVGARIANNPQDDTALITTIENHAGYATTERRGDTRADAGRLKLAADGVTVDHLGLIERPGAESWLLVATGSGALNLRLAPEHDDLPNATNFDGSLSLATLGGSVLFTSNQSGTRFPQLSAPVSPGVYVVRVRSGGDGSATAGGYSDYGSIGRFRVRGTIPAPAGVAPALGGAPRVEGRAGQPLSYAIEAAGAGLAYEASNLPPGLAVDATGLVTGAPSAHGIWRATVRASNGQGAATREVVFAVAGESLAATLDAPRLGFTSGGERPWRGVAEPDAPVGGAHARSGELLDNLGESWIEATLTGPGRLRWRWKSSTERDYDLLHATLDGAVVATISGETPWAERELAVPAGEHRVRWSYDKDDYLSEHQDAVWLDDVRWERGFETWGQAAALAGPNAGAEADPDGDGVPNLLEYAFGCSPTGADPAGSLVTVNTSAAPAPAGGALAVSFVRPAGRTDLRYVVEVSADLVSWQRGHVYAAGAANAAGLPTVELERTALEGGAERIHVRDGTAPGPEAPRRYIRVRVERL